MPLNFDKLLVRSAISNYLDEGNAEPLVNLLRSERKLTPELRNFIADIIEGKIKKKRGRKRMGPPPAGYKIDVEYNMMVLKAINSWKPLQGFNAYEKALEIVAERYGITTSHLDRIMYPRKPKKEAES